MQRADDNEEVIKARLKAYAESTGPLVEYYSKRDFHRVDGARQPEQIQTDIDRILEPARRR
jgi:adenylate kinase